MGRDFPAWPHRPPDGGGQHIRGQPGRRADAPGTAGRTARDPVPAVAAHPGIRVYSIAGVADPAPRRILRAQPDLLLPPVLPAVRHSVPRGDVVIYYLLRQVRPRNS